MEDILDSIDLADTGLLDDVANNQSTKDKNDPINCDQCKQCSNTSKTETENQGAKPADGTTVGVQDHTDPASLDKEIRKEKTYAPRTKTWKVHQPQQMF